MTDHDWHNQETYKSMIQFGHELLKYTFLVNGAAIVALLTFIGNLQTKGVTLCMQLPISIFIAGVVLAGFATMTTYFVQFFLYNEASEPARGIKSHLTWFVITLLLIICSIGCFAFGAFIAAQRLN
jgi:hypothetical protein